MKDSHQAVGHGPQRLAVCLLPSPQRVVVGACARGSLDGPEGPASADISQAAIGPSPGRSQLELAGGKDHWRSGVRGYR
jgi:hypothetical protein